jgi:hypothetical protein
LNRKTIIQFGHGYMGNFHFDAATSAIRQMPSSNIVLVEPLPERQKAAAATMEAKGLDPFGRIFETGEEALEVWHGQNSPFAAIIACDDAQHKPVFDLLRANAPNLRAVFSEKPLTKTLDEARELQPWLSGLDLVTMNTVIDFSAVFPEFRKLQEPGELLHGFMLEGAEGAWLGSYHKYHRELPIGVAGDILHPMNVIVSMLRAGPLEMQSGEGKSGYLNDLSPNIVHDVSSSHWRGTNTGVKVLLRSCYSGDERQRTVIGYYVQGKTIRAAEFNFDRQDKGFEGTDTLSIYEVRPGVKPILLQSFIRRNQDVDMGYAADAQTGKAQAFVGQSLRAFFEPKYRNQLTTLTEAMATQNAVNPIGFDSPVLKLFPVSADDNRACIAEARAKGRLEEVFPFGLSLATSSVENIKARLGRLLPASSPKLVQIVGDRIPDKGASRPEV